MKKVFNSIFLTFALLGYLSAQTTYQAVDPKAKEILDKVSAKTKAYKTIEAEFSFILENKQEDMTDSQKGKIWIKGNKYKIDLMGTSTYYDGKTQWTHMKDAEEVNVTEPDPNDDNTLNPAKMFTIYEKGYKIRYINEKFEDARQLVVIDLYPVDLKKDYSRITLKIDKAKMQIYSLQRFGKDGNYYTIKVLKMTTDQAMDDTMFTFDKTKFPKVEIIDMR